MEDVEKPSDVNSSIDEVKSNAVTEQTLEENCVTPVEADVCHKSNGVADELHNADIADTLGPTEEPASQDVEVISEVVLEPVKEVSPEPKLDSESAQESVSAEDHVESVTETVLEDPSKTSNQETESEIKENTKSNVETFEIIVEDGEKAMDVQQTEIEESIVEIDGIVESTNDRVTFKTEILVESNVNDSNESNTKELQTVEKDNATNLLNELGQNIELSEMLRSSDTSHNVENNNCTSKQEVFNKEELLDILEGKDAEEVDPNALIKETDPTVLAPLEKELALQQLSRLKKKKLINTLEPFTKKKRNDKKFVVSRKEKEPPKVEENIVTALVKEWEDDDPSQLEESTEILEETENLLRNTNELVKKQDTVNRQDKTSARSSVDSTSSDKQTPKLNKSNDESLPQRRLGRVIKKKVIFDPDNPDTFTKGKSVKNKDPQLDKTHSPIKKMKSEHSHQQPKARMPMAKMQWKKPSPKNSNNKYKRLTEVDKLLMDEGAVNMIYQLTPEAPKGKKNMKTKAEFIKKLQSSTPDSKEMKFRERKKDSRSEDGEPRKIAGGKQRSSLSSSVKSPSISEDFEAHSADDSIIYRRHSSSSYSSSCMSPRRLSDVESSAGHNVGRTPQQGIDNMDNHKIKEQNSNVTLSDSLIIENPSNHNKMINKNDCLSIKEKLNSKLSLALNKRKQESTHTEKPAKQKKVAKVIEEQEYKYITMNIDCRLGEICIKKSGSNYNIEVMKELESALQYINSRADVSVTFLSSECGNICTGLDLTPLLNENLEERTKYAHNIAESVRSLLFTMDQHKKLLCTGVNGSCSSVGLALVAMSDVSIASESASFALQSGKSSELRNAPLVPGISVLSASGRCLSKPLLSELVVFGHQVSASDALRHGLVNRTLWPDCFREQLRTIAKDIASQPIQNLVMKKHLLNLTKSEPLSACIEKERDMLIQYWTSAEGQELIRATYGTT